MQKKSAKTSANAKSTKNTKTKIVKTRKATTRLDISKNNLIENKVKEPDLSYIDDDKILKKVEKYVDRNREKTSQEMMERRNKRPSQKFQEGDLEVMISRIDNESKPKMKVKETSKWILYLVYTIIILAIIIFMVKYFFNSNIPQIS